MIQQQQRKSNTIRVLNNHHHQHQLLDNEKNRPSSTLIHVTVGFPKPVRSVDNNLHSNIGNRTKMINPQHQSSQNDFTVSKTYANRPSFVQLNGNIKNNNLLNESSLQFSDSTKISYLSKSSKVIPYENGHTVSDQTGVINDYHRKSKRKEKKKCSRQCFIASLITSIILILILTTILLVVLIKSKTKVTPNSIPVLRWNTTGITIAGLSSNPGNSNNQLDLPFDAILDYANNLYIADYKNSRIQKYLYGSSVGVTICGNGTSGSLSSQLYYPSRIILDSNKNLYIADTANYRIQFWLDGAISGTTVAGITSTAGNASNQLNIPYGITLNPTSNSLYISDYGNQRIMSYVSGVQNGTLVFGGNGLGISNTQLYYPTGLYFDSFSNSLLIANTAANHIVQYVLGANHSTVLVGDISGSSGATSTRFFYPIDVTLDPMGNLYIADRENHRIQFFYEGQTNGTTIAGITNVNSSNATTLNWPWSIKLDNQLNLYVADTMNHRIQKFLRY